MDFSKRLLNYVRTFVYLIVFKLREYAGKQDNKHILVASASTSSHPIISQFQNHSFAWIITSSLKHSTWSTQARQITHCNAHIPNETIAHRSSPCTSAHSRSALWFDNRLEQYCRYYKMAISSRLLDESSSLDQYERPSDDSISRRVVIASLNS